MKEYTSREEHNEERKKQNKTANLELLRINNWINHRRS